VTKLRATLGGRQGALIVTGVGLYLLCLGVLAGLAWEIVAYHDYENAGVWYGTPPNIPQAAVYPLGVNVSLEQYDGEQLEQALDMVQAGGFRWVRQTFPWAEIEPEPGQYDWSRWDLVVDAAREHELSMIAVLETSPSWARAPLDADTPEAPPQDFSDYAEFVRAFAARYGAEIDYYEIWDEPNLYPHWGERYVDPRGYVHLLQAGYQAAKEADPGAVVLSAGLAPNVEEGGRYMSDLLFLEEMYQAGAKGYFDILAVKPYGMWYEPLDRRLSPLETNFSRPILARQVMEGHGDGDKAMWAVEFGWCALPPSWDGPPAPWTSDTEEVQARRTVEAIERARSEWPWMGVLALQHFQPLAKEDDLIWCFALVNEDFQPRLTYTEVQKLAASTSVAYPGWYLGNSWAARYSGAWRSEDDLEALAGEQGQAVLPFKGTRLDVLVRSPLALRGATIDGQPLADTYEATSGERRITLSQGLEYAQHQAVLTVESADGAGGGISGFLVIREANFWRYYLALLFVVGAGLVVVWRLGRLVLLPLSLSWWRWAADWYLGRPTVLQVAVMALALVVFYFSPFLPVALVGLVVLVPLVYLRTDLGLAFAAFSIPFFLRPKILLGQSLSLVEMMTLLCFACWLLRETVQRAAQGTVGNDGPLTTFPSRPVTSLRRLAEGLWRLLVHLVQSSKLLDWATLFFLLVSLFSLTASQNIGVSIYALRTVVVEPVLFYLLLREVKLQDEGLLRVVEALIASTVLIALYGLYQYFVSGDVITAEGVLRIRSVYGSPNNLGLFLGRIVPLVAAVVFFGGGRRRWGYLGAAIPVVIALYLTHSRGAWLLGVPAALIFLGAVRGRKALLAALGAVVAAILALLPLAGVERFRSLFDLSGGTAFFRVKLWEAALRMIRDHPFSGVGLDNFLYQYPRYMLPEAWQEPDLSHPHNILLDWWLSLGLLGVGALIWLEVAFYRSAWRVYRSLDEGMIRAVVLGLMASMVDFLAHGLIDNSYFLVDLAFVFFLTLGMVRRLSARAGS
jgi:O-antigen ligase